MQTFTSLQRAPMLAKMAEDTLDVLVIGGGVTGAGVALDAAMRGYKVALVEKADFASGTSSKSTKLVHGGIRYLPNFDFSLVHEALVERGLLLRNAPFLVQPIAFVLPIYHGERHPVGMPFTTPGGIGLNELLNVGLGLYDFLAGRNNIHRHRRLKRAEVAQLAPPLLTENLQEGFVYYDAQTNDARLTMALLRTAASQGALLANYAEVTSFLKDDAKVCGVHVQDHLNHQTLSLYARHIVNATGIFAEQVESLSSNQPQIQIEPSKGVHLVFSREDLNIGENAVVLPETDDKRILFIVPWESRVILGTTDTGSGDLNHPSADREDIDYLLGHLNRYLSTKLTREHIISTYAGYRPLLKTRSGKHSNARLSRTHAVLENPNGLVSITGGKLTTYRRMAQDTLDTLNKRDGRSLTHPTENLPLQGSVGWSNQKARLELEGARLGLAPAILAQMGRSYGTEMSNILTLIKQDASLASRLVDDLPYIRAEVVYACRHEMAMTPYDVLARRTSITLEDRLRGLGCLDEIATLMAQELHWTPEQQHTLANDYSQNIDRYMLAEAKYRTEKHHHG